MGQHRSGGTNSPRGKKAATISELRRHFEEAALPFANVLLRLARHLTGNQEDAEEVVQETFLRAYRTFENFEPGSNCKAWLFTILYSIVKNRYRRSSRRITESSLTELEERGPQGLDSNAWGSHHELLNTLDEARVSREVVDGFAKLPPDWRMIVLLVDVEELSYEEVSLVLDCPVGTVSSRLYRARKHLFESLAPFARQQGYTKS